MNVIVSIAALAVIALLALDSFGMLPEEAEVVEAEVVETEVAEADEVVETDEGVETEAEPIEIEDETELQSSIKIDIVDKGKTS